MEQTKDPNDDEYVPNCDVAEGSISSQSSMSEMLNPLGELNDKSSLAGGSTLRPQKTNDPKKFYLWQFLFNFLKDPNGWSIAHFTREGQDRMEFIIVDKDEFAKRWGMHKRNRPMIWENVTRSLRNSYNKRYCKTEENKQTGNYRYTLISSEEVLNYFNMSIEELEQHISIYCK